MSEMVAGAASGMLAASVFVCAGVLMVFSLVKDRPRSVLPIMGKLSPGRLVMSGVFLAYPTWAVIGAVMGLLYRIADEQVPGSGFGSPILVFTLSVVVATLMLAAPVAILLRRVVVGVLAITLAVVGVFGWFLPYFAA